jgi:hypothetical protein
MTVKKQGELSPLFLATNGNFGRQGRGVASSVNTTTPDVVARMRPDTTPFTSADVGERKR